LRAEISQCFGGKRPGDQLTEFKNADAGEDLRHGHGDSVEGGHERACISLCTGSSTLPECDNATGPAQPYAA